eukprot:1159203-Pelagomonas_calceolata.AAC.8
MLAIISWALATLCVLWSWLCSSSGHGPWTRQAIASWACASQCPALSAGTCSAEAHTVKALLFPGHSLRARWLAAYQARTPQCPALFA